MKCFERLVMHHIKSAPLSLDPFQFAYRSNRSTDDAIATALHSALTHTDKKDSYVRMLFIDFSSAFNTIIPQQLIHKLVQLGLNTSLCNWLLDFLTGRAQAVRVGSNTSSTITLNTGAPQGYVLSPLLFTLLTHDCTPSHNPNLFIKFADDTTVVGLISNRDETNYRSEVSRMARWCKDNNLSLNVEKTKEIVVDFRRVNNQHAPLTVYGASVARVSSTKFLGVHITEDLSWTDNTAALAKKSQQRLYYLCRLRRARAPAPIMCTFYRGTIENILMSCITAWYGTCNASCRKTLQRIVRTTEKIIVVSLPSLQNIYGTHLTRKALCIAGDPTHPSHSFFSLLPSGRRLRSLQARTSRLKDSYFNQVPHPQVLPLPPPTNIR
uniref:Reverse transcriptase domain-containing protein n=1 Tax=Cyprinus carpio TaxID=7962 RepID=A0A8C2GHX3_CYPCA